MPPQVAVPRPFEWNPRRFWPAAGLVWSGQLSLTPVPSPPRRSGSSLAPAGAGPRRLVAHSATGQLGAIKTGQSTSLTAPNVCSSGERILLRALEALASCSRLLTLWNLAGSHCARTRLLRGLGARSMTTGASGLRTGILLIGLGAPMTLFACAEPRGSGWWQVTWFLAARAHCRRWTAARFSAGQANQCFVHCLELLAFRFLHFLKMRFECSFALWAAVGQKTRLVW